MTQKRILTDAEIATMIEMRAKGRGIEPISKHLKCGRTLVYNSLNERGLIFGRQNGGQKSGKSHPAKRESARDPVTALPIGQIPPDHPLYEIDQQILRARRTRSSAEGAPRKSSMAWD